MSDDRRFEPDHIYDLPPLSPSADHFELLEHQHREDQWRRTREPVAAGSKFLKFLTWRDMVDIGLLTEEQVIGSDDPFKPIEPGGPDDDSEIDDARVYAYARDFDPNTSTPCSALTVVSFGATKPDAKVLMFDPTTSEAAETQLILPPEWPGRSLQARIYWSHPLATSWGVVWEVRAHSATDGENMAVDYVGGMIAVDEGGDTNHLYISASNVVTIGTGSAMPGDLVLIKVIRRTDHADDTLNADAYFHAIEFLVGNSPAEFPPTGQVSWDADEANAYWTLSGDNKVATLNTESPAQVHGTGEKASGKWYCEVLVGGSPNTGFPHSPSIGVCDESEGDPGFVELVGNSSISWGYFRDGQKGNGAIYSAYGASYGLHDVIGVALDLDNGKVWFSKNGTWQASGDPAAGTNAAFTGITGTLVMNMTANKGAPSGTLRSSAGDCDYTPPSGFSYWTA